MISSSLYFFTLPVELHIIPDDYQRYPTVSDALKNVIEDVLIELTSEAKIVSKVRLSNVLSRDGTTIWREGHSLLAYR